MSNVSVMQKNPTMADIERVMVHGDLAPLTSEQRVSYYNEMCKSLGLNPLTKPFEYIKLSGKLTLYAKRDAADQLRKIYNISILITDQQTSNDLFIVTAKARFPDGREDQDLGVVSIGGLKGEALANAMLKATTKAKRRVTLSICGLGMLDETEVDSIPGATRESSEPRDVTPKPTLVTAETKVHTPIQNFADYVIPFGKYSKENIKLSDIPLQELQSYFDYLTRGVAANREEGKRPNFNTVEALERIQTYLESEMELAADHLGALDGNGGFVHG